ncbi:hypothetical protein Patl1_13236 [Pistacia atlantica]|uniref:Uncharacterized protein n=1 Tax=Pistacia atlantica TaxID=434234 RepID=A0ACC1AXU1_9ROSI|nr:hypothetical protein Patl1_13236 [Pistacia atlantica]
MPNFHIDMQRDIVLATMIINNYIRKKNTPNMAFQVVEKETYMSSLDGDGAFSSDGDNAFTNNNYCNAYGENTAYWMAMRDLIATEICII